MAQMQAPAGQLLRNEPLARYTSWRTGGAAEHFYIPAGLDDLASFLQSLDTGEPIHFIGLGSNLLVRDGGVRGTVVLMHNALTGLHVDQQAGDGLIYAEAGVTCAKLAKFAARQHKHGAEFMAGIPGTVGGALAMNAGCHGSETWDIVAHVQTIDRRGNLHRRDRQQFAVSYRHVEMAPQGEAGNQPLSEWFVGAWFALVQGEGSASEQKIKDLLARRLATQPLNWPNAGSVFRNPPGDHAARLVEACGLKGYTIGDAQVSEKHANFIINRGTATAADIEQLIAHVRETVKARYGVELQQEVRIIGEAANG